MTHILKYFCVMCCVFVITKAVFAASTCATGYSTLDVEKHIDTTYKTFDESTFMKPEGGLCKIGGYVLLEIPDDVYPIYNGFIMGSEVTLCNNGFLVNNGSCSTYAAGECPEDYEDLSLNANTMATLTNGSCASGYQTYILNQQCDENTTDAICGILCSSGLSYTDIGTCAQICQAGHTTLRTGTGLIYPMYATKQITPSINLGIGNSVCYVNLVPGSAEGALHIKYNNQTYHAVQ